MGITDSFISHNYSDDVITMSMRNFLVVGINGMIGSALFSRLLYLSNIKAWGTTHRYTADEQSNVFYLNLLDPLSSWNFQGITFDVIYLCAGVCQMSLCENDPVFTYKVNVSGATALAKHLAQTGAFIVYLSTNQVFSGDRPFVKADAPYHPLNEYGRQKAEVEELIKSACPAAAIVRLTKVIEPHMQLIQNWISNLNQNPNFLPLLHMQLYHISQLSRCSLY